MKTNYMFLTIYAASLLIIARVNAQGWVKSYDKNNNHYTSVYFIDDKTGFIAGVSKSLDKGFVLRTSDSGDNWNNVCNSTKPLFTFCFLNNLTGFASGAGGLLLKTTNGGIQWANSDVNITGTILSILFINDKNGFIAGSYESGGSGFIFYTSNGGDDWTNSTPNGLNGLGNIYFINDNTGFACGTGKTLKKTTDQGKSWIFKDFPLILPTAEYNFLSIRFVNQNTGFVTGGGKNGNGLILSTSDGGDNWKLKETEKAMNSLYFINENTGYASGLGGFITKTTDGGATWTTLKSGCGDILYSIFFVNANTGYAVGEHGVLLKTVTGGE